MSYRPYRTLILFHETNKEIISQGAGVWFYIENKLYLSVWDSVPTKSNKANFYMSIIRLESIYSIRRVSWSDYCL